MDIEGALGLRESFEFSPVPTREQLTPVLQSQRPAVERCLLRRTCRQDWEFLRDILSGWDAISCCPGVRLFTFEPSGHLHDDLLSIETHVSRGTEMELTCLRHRGDLVSHPAR